MPPTADNSIVGHRSSVRITAPQIALNHKTMRTVTMMNGENNPPNGFTTEETATTEKKSSKYDFFYKEPCYYTHKIYSNAAKVFNCLRHETRDELENPYYRKKVSDEASSKKVVLPEFDFEDDNEKRLSYELAFETLKYQRVFEDLLDECSFFVSFPECSEDESLVKVVLWDYQNRKFQQRTPLQDEVQDPIVQSVEDAILEYKTKLNASLARHRIKAAAPSLEFLLPEKVRSKEEIACKLPVHIWVNMLKTNLDTVVGLFKDDHYSLVDAEDRQEGRVFYIDPHCPDVLVLPSDSRGYIQDHDLYVNGHIVMQDKSSCIAPHSVKYLIGDDDDIIHVNAGSLVTTAHISSLMTHSTGHIFAFGSFKGGETSKTIERLGAKNIKVQAEDFLEAEMDDNKFRNVKVVLVTADCSKSGISNPIDFIVNEGEDMKILKYLSVGETDDGKLGEMIGNHSALLRQAMKLSKVQAIVYMTRSIFESENENVVTRSVEQTNTIQQRKHPFRVVPPVLPFTGHEIEKGIGISGKYIKYKPTEKNCGCFVAVITRESGHCKKQRPSNANKPNVDLSKLTKKQKKLELPENDCIDDDMSDYVSDPEDLKLTSKDVLARAKAKGLLGEKKKKKKTLDTAEQNGDVSEDETEDEKLLEKRVKRAPRRLRATGSAPHPLPAYVRPSGTSVVRSQIYSSSKSPTRATKSMAALKPKASNSRAKVLATPPIKKEIKPVVAEHEKVVKHPAPFR